MPQQKIANISAAPAENKREVLSMKKLTDEQYAELAARYSPKSRTGPDIIAAFACGGAVCVLGELLGELYASLGAGEDAAMYVSATLVALGALLTALGVYDSFASFAGAGALVPITGFANAVAAPAIEFRSEGMITGLAAGLFTISGPVIVYGTAAGTLYGLVLCLLG